MKRLFLELKASVLEKLLSPGIWLWPLLHRQKEYPKLTSPTEVIRLKTMMAELPRRKVRNKLNSWKNCSVRKRPLRRRSRCCPCARLAVTSRELKISLHSWRRQKHSFYSGLPEAVRRATYNRLILNEKAQMTDISHRQEYASLLSLQMVPRLSDKFIYLACESTYHQVLLRYGEVLNLGCQSQPQRVHHY